MSVQLPEQPEIEDSPIGGEATTPVMESIAPAETGQGMSLTARSWLLDFYMAALIFTTFVVDQLTKGWVRDHLLLGSSIPTEGLFRITHASNTGSAFGLFPNQTFLLILGSIVGIVILLIFYRKQPIPGVWLRTSLGLELGGAAGNLVDRITLGKVTDFIDIGAWPVFNLADSSIVVGIGILAWFIMRSPRGGGDAEERAIPDEMEAPSPYSPDDADAEG